MQPEEGAGRVRAFFDQWPIGTQFTTRGVQVGAGIPDLRLTEEAAEQLRAQGFLVMESIGATHLWRRCEPAPTSEAVEISPLSLPVTDTPITASAPATLNVG
jgi:hypothetical protein